MSLHDEALRRGIQSLLDEERDHNYAVIIRQIETIRTNQEQIMADFGTLSNAIRNEIANVIADYQNRLDAALANAATDAERVRVYEQELSNLQTAIEAEGTYGQDTPSEPAPGETPETGTETPGEQTTEPTPAPSEPTDTPTSGDTDTDTTTEPVAEPMPTENPVDAPAPTDTTTTPTDTTSQEAPVTTDEDDVNSGGSIPVNPGDGGSGL